MTYFRPKIIYKRSGAERKNSILKYLRNRVSKQNQNALIFVSGGLGMGKSYACLKMAELYSEMFNVSFDPTIHIISSLKELLLLITSKDIDKKIQFGSVIVFDEPQIEANSRAWQSEINKAFSQLISTFRNQRLVIFFAAPYLNMLDKQSRILFLGDFQVLGFNKDTRITRIKPRFLEYVKEKDELYRKRLVVEYAVENKLVRNKYFLNIWEIPRASAKTIEIYEHKKKRFTDDLNLKLLHQIELKEKQTEGKNKSDEIFKVKELYDKYGDNYLKIMEELPHLSPFIVEKYIQFIKKSIKRGGGEENE